MCDRNKPKKKTYKKKSSEWKKFFEYKKCKKCNKKFPSIDKLNNHKKNNCRNR